MVRGQKRVNRKLGRKGNQSERRGQGFQDRGNLARRPLPAKDFRTEEDTSKKTNTSKARQTTQTTEKKWGTQTARETIHGDQKPRGACFEKTAREGGWGQREIEEAKKTR